MSGHNKWSKIKRKKAAEDQKKGKVFGRLVKEIKRAVREGGEDIEANAALRAVIARAQEENMPKENIQRAIDRGAGRGEMGPLTVVQYEAYGPGGGAFLVEARTDNKNRTAQEIKQILQECDGRLADVGSVRWMFKGGECSAPTTLEGRDLEVFQKGYEALQEHEDVDRVLTNITNV